MKISKQIISLPLSQLINDSISKWVFSNHLKTSTVHRPISLFSNISKMFEKVIHGRLNSFLDHRNRLYPYQFGFHINYSTNNALMTIV